MPTIQALITLAALVCFALGAFGVPSRVSWTPLGLLFLTIALLVL